MVVWAQSRLGSKNRTYQRQFQDIPSPKQLILILHKSAPAAQRFFDPIVSIVVSVLFGQGNSLVIQSLHMASRSVNKVILVGHLGKDAETKFTPSGAAVTKFSVATNRRWKDQQSGEWKEETNWTNVSLWRAENLAQYLTRGKQVYVEGRLQTRSYDDKDGKKVYATDVVADDVILLSGNRGESGGGAGGDEFSQSAAAPVSMPRGAQSRGAAASARPAAAEEPAFDQGITDDDVPF